MSLRITGFDKFQKKLSNAQKAFRSLDGTLGTLQFDPNEPASVLAAINQMESIIDAKVVPYRGNALVEGVASRMKQSYREQITQRAALARSKQKGENMSTEQLPGLLRQIENTVNDLRWADSSSFVRHVKKLSRLLHDSELDEITSNLVEGIDLEAWLKAGEDTQGGMVGSAELEWPTTLREELGIVVLLIDRFANEPDSALNFSHTFYYNGNNISANLQHMSAQMIVPFARDYIDHVKSVTGISEATILPTNSEPAARKVFVVHGHDEGAKQSIARFLEKLNFEAIILHEQPSQGRTIIEKVEAHSDVGFAVVLLTPDDEGNARGGQSQPRARQNVILELGYFLGRLGRSRVMALKQGDLEIPSDFHGVVYEPFASGGGWKSALGRELEAAGFTVDWNVVMKS